MLLLILFTVFAYIPLQKVSFLQTTSDDYSSFNANMAVNQDNYQVQCQCTDNDIIEIEEVKCNPTKIKLTQQQEGTGSSYKDVSQKLSNDQNYTYARVTHSSFRCLDGRITDKMLGTPGGDAGEFVLGLLSYKDLAGIDLTQDLVSEYLTDYLLCMDMSNFYMCTDNSAIEHLKSELVLDSLDIYNPDPSTIPELLDALIEPNNVGDRHLKLMLEYPDLYSIDKSIVEYFITAFYTMLWSSDNPLHETLYLEVLEGPHKETAFLEVRVNEDCIVEKVAPLISPEDNSTDTMSLLINDIDAASIRRYQIAQFFAERINNEYNVTTDKMKGRLDHHGLLFLDITGSYISKGLPFYTATFV
jgi:hypothetical protein